MESLSRHQMTPTRHPKLLPPELVQGEGLVVLGICKTGSIEVYSQPTTSPSNSWDVGSEVIQPWTMYYLSKTYCYSSEWSRRYHPMVHLYEGLGVRMALLLPLTQCLLKVSIGSPSGHPP